MEQQKKNKNAPWRVSAKKLLVSPVEKIYQETSEEATKKELQKINKPQVRRVKLNPRLIRVLALILAVLVVSFTVYSLFFRGIAKSSDWYAVKLVNGETFYGQVKDTKADPVVMVNVYYNYDQADSSKQDTTETGNLRLVKRGQETHGPAGTMDIVRSQVLFMEPMKADSKVLKAILEYEK